MQITEIHAHRKWYQLEIKELLKYKYLAIAFAKRDIKVRYGQTILGFLWILFQPLISIAVLYVIFGKVAGLESNHDNYIPFVLIGVLFWQYFNNVFNEGSQSLVNAQNMISKVYFPKIYLPFSKGITFMVDLIMVILVLILVSSQYDFLSVRGILLAFVFIPFFILFSLSCGVIGSVLVARFRDLKFIYPFLLQIGLYASPVAYNIDDVPQKYQTFLYLNPLTFFIEGFRTAWLHVEFDASTFMYCCLISFVTFILALFSFNKIEPTLADII